MNKIIPSLILILVIAISIDAIAQEETVNTDSISKSQFETVFEKSKGKRSKN